jgi:hypothetical protein
LIAVACRVAVHAVSHQVSSGVGYRAATGAERGFFVAAKALQ